MGTVQVKQSGAQVLVIPGTNCFEVASGDYRPFRTDCHFSATRGPLGRTLIVSPLVSMGGKRTAAAEGARACGLVELHGANPAEGDDQNLSPPTVNLDSSHPWIGIWAAA